MNKAEIETGCKISKPAQRRIDILCELGFDITVIPRNHYNAYGSEYEDSYNYLSEGVTWDDLGEDYHRHIIPDNISDYKMVDIIKTKLNVNKVEEDELFDCE